jgi:hypothetical protein
MQLTHPMLFTLTRHTFNVEGHASNCLFGTHHKWVLNTLTNIPNSLCVGQARTIYIRCIYGIFGREITKYTVIYGV